MHSAPTLEPDVGIPLPENPPKLSDFGEKLTAAIHTFEALEVPVPVLDGSEWVDDELTEKEQDLIEQTVYAAAANKVPKALQNQLATAKPAIYHQTKLVLDEFSHRVVDNATQIRLLVTNKLILESDNPDPKIRLRALELLGKITDVGLFTEKSEVTVNHRSTNDLVDGLRAKIQKLMYGNNPIQDAEVVAVNGVTVDVEKELGLEPEREPNEGEANETND